MTSKIHGEPTDNNRHGAVGSTSDQEQGGILGVSVVMNDHQHGKACYGKANRSDCEEESMTNPIRNCSNKHTETKSSGPRGDRVQLSLNGTIPVGFDDRGCKVGVSVGLT